jgi:hypothetical protein
LSLLLVFYSRKGIVKLKHLLPELIVLLVCVFDLADSVLDRLPDFYSFPLGILILAAGFYELFPEVVDLFLEERSI